MGRSVWRMAQAAAASALMFVATLTAGPVLAASMPSFQSEAELVAWLQGDGAAGEIGIKFPTPPPRPRPPVPANQPTYEYSDSTEVEGIVVTGSRIVRQDFEAISPVTTVGSEQLELTATLSENSSITSNQVVGVDEGGIVKVSGEYLVVLHRGRVFTVSTAEGGLVPVDSINAYPPGVDARDDWYDEMLVRGDLVAVIGYSYERGGTEINRFRIGRDGQLTFIDAYHLRSSDYYSDRNYASRLVGNQLVIYAPLELGHRPLNGKVMDAFPALSRWRPGETVPHFNSIVGPREVFVPAPLRRAGPASLRALHTVQRCDLTAVEMTCQATVVLGAEGRSFYVSQDAVYVWVGSRSWWGEIPAPAYLYRMPLNGSPPTAVGVHGMPIDQFSFNAARDGSLNVFVGSNGEGDRMWAPEFKHARPAMARIPARYFGDGSHELRSSDYRWLPGADLGDVVDRYIGDYFVYSWSKRRGAKSSDQLVVVPLRGGRPTVFSFAYQIERIEQMGRDALVVGGDDALIMQSVEFAPNDRPRLGDRFVQPDSQQAESRSHAFFYRPDSPDGQDGLLGLPTLRLSGDERIGDMMFLRRRNLRLTDFGRLVAKPELAEFDHDQCVASCFDWYGNSRPIFLRGRVFALLGYELVEGDATGESIREVRRVNFAPRPAAR